MVPRGTATTQTWIFRCLGGDALFDGHSPSAFLSLLPTPTIRTDGAWPWGMSRIPLSYLIPLTCYSHDLEPLKNIEKQVKSLWCNFWEYREITIRTVPQNLGIRHFARTGVLSAFGAGVSVRDWKFGVSSKAACGLLLLRTQLYVLSLAVLARA